MGVNTQASNCRSLIESQIEQLPRAGRSSRSVRVIWLHGLRRFQEIEISNPARPRKIGPMCRRGYIRLTSLCCQIEKGFIASPIWTSKKLYLQSRLDIKQAVYPALAERHTTRVSSLCRTALISHQSAYWFLYYDCLGG